MFADPENNIAQFQLQPGARVADLGAGTGFYSIAAAKAIGPDGKVYAIEVQQDLLDTIKQEAQRHGVANIEVVWGDIEHPKGTRLRDQSIDAVIVSNVLFQLKERAGHVAEVARILKASGKVLVIDWKDSYGGMGPQPGELISESEVQDIFTQGGFASGQPIQAGEHHFGLIFKRS